MLIKNKNFFLIAEIGINHGGDYKKAIKLINSAHASGASAVKFQTYKTEKRVKKNSPIFNILKKCELSFSEFEKIKNYCDKKKIFFFSTPFDIDSVNFLNELKVKLFKISSFDISNYQLIKSISYTKKPVIISTGMASLKEIKKVNQYFSNKKIEHYLLHCVSSYPNNEENSLLSNIKYLMNNFDCGIGLSDHTNDIKTTIYARVLGAKIFEKHFKISEKDNCVDSKVSITPEQMKRLVNELSKINKILGKVEFGIRKNERGTKIFKRNKIL
tara:strand:+ start:622 stop:1437 length:816 start_codon:yes stop_codon:yes gene_type:complete